MVVDTDTGEIQIPDTCTTNTSQESLARIYPDLKDAAAGGMEEEEEPLVREKQRKEEIYPVSGVDAAVVGAGVREMRQKRKKKILPLNIPRGAISHYTLRSGAPDVGTSVKPGTDFIGRVVAGDVEEEEVAGVAGVWPISITTPEVLTEVSLDLGDAGAVGSTRETSMKQKNTWIAKRDGAAAAAAVAAAIK